MRINRPIELNLLDRYLGCLCGFDKVARALLDFAPAEDFANGVFVFRARAHLEDILPGSFDRAQSPFETHGGIEFIVRIDELDVVPWNILVFCLIFSVLTARNRGAKANLRRRL